MQKTDTRPSQSMTWLLIIGFLLAGSAHSEKGDTASMKTIVGSVW